MYNKQLSEEQRKIRKELKERLLKQIEGKQDEDRNISHYQSHQREAG